MAQYDAPINANDVSFERVVLKAPLPVAAVFWSPRDVPRKLLNVPLERIAEQYAGEALVVKLDVDDAPQAQAEYKVDVLPQFLFFRQEKLIARARGLPTAEMLRPWMEYLLERGPKPAIKKPAEKDVSTGDGHPITVTDADFDHVVLKGKKPVLVDFWAAWCGPCRMVAPIVDELAGEYDGKVGFVKLNVDNSPGVAGKYGVMSIPTLMLFKDGKPVNTIIGYRPKEELKQSLDKVL